MTQERTIVGLGEALFDLLPGGKTLGGAPLNVACHAQQLLADRGGRGVVASRIGSDDLGDVLVAELTKRGMPAKYVQRDPRYKTGTVRVTIQDGQPSYEISADRAWDHCRWTPDWSKLAASCAAVTYGTLAQRSPMSRATIGQFLDAAPQAVRMFDVNLRQQFYIRTVLDESCRRATIVKLNQNELPVLAALLDLKSTTVDGQLAELRSHYELDAVVYTRAERGTLLVLEDGPVDTPPVSYPAAVGADTVGAGDACAAAVLAGWVCGLPPEKIAELANHLGAYVASQPGATPPLPPELTGLVD